MAGGRAKGRPRNVLDTIIAVVAGRIAPLTRPSPPTQLQFRGIVDLAGPTIAPLLRVGAQRQPVLRRAVRIGARLDGIRSLAVPGPGLQRGQRVELVRAGATAAMAHARHQEQPHTRLPARQAVLQRRTLPTERDGLHRLGRGIARAAPQDHLAPLGDEPLQLRWVGRVTRVGVERPKTSACSHPFASNQSLPPGP